MSGSCRVEFEGCDTFIKGRCCRVRKQLAVVKCRKKHATKAACRVCECLYFQTIILDVRIRFSGTVAGAQRQVLQRLGRKFDAGNMLGHGIGCVHRGMIQVGEDEVEVTLPIAPSKACTGTVIAGVRAQGRIRLERWPWPDYRPPQLYKPYQAL